MYQKLAAASNNFEYKAPRFDDVCVWFFLFF